LESQKVEWKHRWREELFKRICGLANTRGGTLEIERNDAGSAIEIDSAKELLEELPDAIRRALGVVPSVELLVAGGKLYIAVNVEASASPVSFCGRHYIHSGGAIQELRGRDTDNFLLRRLGAAWDGYAVPRVKTSDLDESAFRVFLERAVMNERMRRPDLKISRDALLESLSLFENGALTRAAVLLFHSNPEKYFLGAFIKVDYFNSGADLVYQDELHGSLITLADRAADAICEKYSGEPAGCGADWRATDCPVPHPALREAVFNAIIHRDYKSGAPIRIKVFPDCVVICNDGGLPANWTVSDLTSGRRSRPYNPKIAYAFYRAGFIETWGGGIERITSVCRDAGKREPLFEAPPGAVSVTLFAGGAIGENAEYLSDAGAVAERETTAGESNGENADVTDSGRAAIGEKRGAVNGEAGARSGAERSAGNVGKPAAIEVIGELGGSIGDNDGFTIGDKVGTGAGVNIGVGKTKAKILLLMGSTPSISARAIAAQIGIAPRNVEVHIQAMKKAGLIERAGPAKGGRWVVK
jgi:ATP-dependent DNA helicase RecG